MAKRKRKKISSTLTWKAARGFFRLLFQGVMKGIPLLIFSALAFGAFWGIRQNLYADPGFLVRTVEVVPEGSLPPGEVTRIEKRFLNRHIFDIPIQKISKELEQAPRVQRARVLRRLPNTLRVEITGRRPFVQIRSSSNNLYYTASEDGVLLEPERERDPELLLVEMIESGWGRIEYGRRVALPGLWEAIELVKKFRKRDPWKTEKIERVRLDRSGNVTLLLEKGPELRFGRRPLERLGALEGAAPLLNGPDRSRIVYIDLQYQDLVVRKK